MLFRVKFRLRDAETPSPSLWLVDGVELFRWLEDAPGYLVEALLVQQVESGRYLLFSRTALHLPFAGYYAIDRDRIFFPDGRKPEPRPIRLTALRSAFGDPDESQMALVDSQRRVFLFERKFYPLTDLVRWVAPLEKCQLGTRSIAAFWEPEPFAVFADEEEEPDLAPIEKQIPPRYPSTRSPLAPVGIVLAPSPAPEFCVMPIADLEMSILENLEVADWTALASAYHDAGRQHDALAALSLADFLGEPQPVDWLDQLCVKDVGVLAAHLRRGLRHCTPEDRLLLAESSLSVIQQWQLHVVIDAGDSLAQARATDQLLAKLYHKTGLTECLPTFLAAELILRTESSRSWIMSNTQKMLDWSQRGLPRGCSTDLILQLVIQWALSQVDSALPDEPRMVAPAIKAIAAAYRYRIGGGKGSLPCGIVASLGAASDQRYAFERLRRSSRIVEPAAIHDSYAAHTADGGAGAVVAAALPGDLPNLYRRLMDQADDGSRYEIVFAALPQVLTVGVDFSREVLQAAQRLGDDCDIEILDRCLSLAYQVGCLELARWFAAKIIQLAGSDSFCLDVIGSRAFADLARVAPRDEAIRIVSTIRELCHMSNWRHRRAALYAAAALHRLGCTDDARREVETGFSWLTSCPAREMPFLAVALATAACSDSDLGEAQKNASRLLATTTIAPVRCRLSTAAFFSAWHVEFIEAIVLGLCLDRPCHQKTQHWADNLELQLRRAAIDARQAALMLP